MIRGIGQVSTWQWWAIMMSKYVNHFDGLVTSGLHTCKWHADVSFNGELKFGRVDCLISTNESYYLLKRPMKVILMAMVERGSREFCPRIFHGSYKDNSICTLLHYFIYVQTHLMS